MWFPLMQHACLFARNAAKNLRECDMGSTYVEVAEERLIGMGLLNLSTGRQHKLFEYSTEPVFPRLITEILARSV